MYNNTLHVLSRLLFYGTLLAYINLKNRKIDQNTVYPLFSRNANYAEVEHICNIIFFFYESNFYNSKNVMAHTDIISVCDIFLQEKNTKIKI